MCKCVPKTLSNRTTGMIFRLHFVTLTPSSTPHHSDSEMTDISDPRAFCDTVSQCYYTSHYILAISRSPTLQIFIEKNHVVRYLAVYFIMLFY